MPTASKQRKSKTAKHAKVDVKQRISDRILELLDQGTVPWRAPWTAAAEQGRHRSLSTGRPYRGVNQFLLAFTEWTSPYWMTFNYMSKNGGRLKFDEPEKRRSQTVFFHKRILVKDEGKIAAGDPDAKRAIWIVKHYNVFNLDQVEGIDAPAESGPVAPIEAAEAIVAGYEDGPSIGYGKPSYSPALDHVSMFNLGEFDTPDGYYATLFHELAHSTGHADRLNRPGIADGIAEWGDEKYADEELVAEMAGAMLAATAGLNVASLEENTAAYIDHWRKRISEDVGLVIAAGSRAQKAVDLILNETPDYGEDS